MVVRALASFERGARCAAGRASTRRRSPSPSSPPVAARRASRSSAPVAARRRRDALAPAALADRRDPLAARATARATSRSPGPAADAYFARLDEAVDRAPKDADFAVTSGGDPGRSRAAGARARRAAHGDARSSPPPISPTGARRQLAVSVAQPERTTAEAKAMGITGVVGTLHDDLRRRRRTGSTTSSSSRTCRRQADRAGRDVLVQRHDRRADGRRRASWRRR